MERPASYEEWERTVPAAIAEDSLWQMRAYRIALFLSDLGWQDATRLAGDRRAVGLADQPVRSLGSVGANLAEGYSRGTGKDRARLYEYAQGSARESRDWCYRAQYILGEAVLHHRLDLLTEVIRLLLTMVPQQRGRVLREPRPAYQADPAAPALPPDDPAPPVLSQPVPC